MPAIVTNVAATAYWHLGAGESVPFAPPLLSDFQFSWTITNFGPDAIGYQADGQAGAAPINANTSQALQANSIAILASAAGKSASGSVSVKNL
jgi:hypothetical protein